MIIRKKVFLAGEEHSDGSTWESQRLPVLQLRVVMKQMIMTRKFQIAKISIVVSAKKIVLIRSAVS